MTYYVDAKVDYKSGKLLLISPNGIEDTLDLLPPYFYLIVEKSKVRAVQALLNTEDTDVEPDPRKPVAFNGVKYVVNDDFKVLRVLTSSPNVIPKLSEELYEKGFRVSASNVRYVIRNCFDRFIRFFDVVPIYWGLDPTITDKISKAFGLVIDVETVNGKPVLASTLVYRPFEEPRREAVKAYKLPDEADELFEELNKFGIIYGHNIVGFDLPVLERSGIAIPKQTKLLFDTSVVLATYGSSLGVGSARSLLDVAEILAKDVGITDEELGIKRDVGGRVESLSWEEMSRYNANDVVLTAKILNSIAPFIYTVSAVTGIPTNQVIELPSGMIAEYAFLRFMELLGYIPEYRYSPARLEGERVYLYAENKTYSNVVHVDVKAMYPSFVLNNFVDPTLHVGNRSFDRMAGNGFLYSFVRRIFNVRMLTRRRKKEDLRYEPIDKGMKAILNALAYGVQAKSSGLAIMGNKFCPEKIFYGTREAQFSTIAYLNKKGYKVVYSDTDSFMIIPNGKSVDEVIKDVNDYLAQFGLEADLEEVWDTMFVYRKKNYILRKGDKVVFKGSALRNLDKYYLPDAVSLQQLIKTNDRSERLSLIKHSVYSARIEDLFIRTHQQVWRLIGKDVQSWKRLGERRSRYIVALTPWSEKPSIVLKKGHLSHFILPHSNPILSIFIRYIESGKDGSFKVTIPIEEINPFEIVEFHGLRFEGPLMGIKARYGSYDLLGFNGRTFLVSLQDLRYVVKWGDKEVKLPCNYVVYGNSNTRPILASIEGVVKVRWVDIDDRIIRDCVYEYVKHKLREYGFL